MAKILLIDDEATILNVLRVVLMADKHDVTALSNGEEVIEILGKEKFDLMLSDIRMNPINGLELLRHVHDQKIPMPVIMLTGRGQKELTDHTVPYLSKLSLNRRDMTIAILKHGTLTPAQAHRLLGLGSDIVASSREILDAFTQASRASASMVVDRSGRRLFPVLKPSSERFRSANTRSGSTSKWRRILGRSPADSSSSLASQCSISTS